MSDRVGHSERNKMRGKTAMKMNGARILVEELIHQGVRVVFGYPGGAVLDIYNELYLASDRIGHVLAAHEQGAAHAADGYARASGKTGVVLATSGPGATNLVTGIANAYLDSVPMVAITGNVAVNSLGKDSFQEVDIVGITQPVVKHNFMVRDIKDLQRTIIEAFEIANSGRKGPVLIDIPKNVQSAEYEYIEDLKVPSGSPERSSGALKTGRRGDRSFHDGNHFRSGLLSAESWNVRHARKISVHQGPVRM